MLGIKLGYICCANDQKKSNWIQFSDIEQREYLSSSINIFISFLLNKTQEY